MASIYDWIWRCPYFCSPTLIRFGAKIRPFQLQQLAVSAPGGALNTPKIRSSFSGTPQSPSRAIRFQILTTTKQKDRLCLSFLFGGDGGIRTHVRLPAN